MLDILKVGGFFATSILRFFTFFSIFRLSTIFIFFSDIGIVFIGMEKIFFVIFLTEFEAGIAKNQNFGDNSFFFKLNFRCNLKWCSKIFYTIWGAENFFRVIFWGEKYVEKNSANLGGIGCTTLLT